MSRQRNCKLIETSNTALPINREKIEQQATTDLEFSSSERYQNPGRYIPIRVFIICITVSGRHERRGRRLGEGCNQEWVFME